MFFAVTGTMAATKRNPMRDFDPDELARCEAENWIYYYQHRWLALFRVVVKTLSASFGLSLWETLRCAYWGTRAEMVAAPKVADTRKAEAYMRKFYRVVRRRSGENFDPRKVAALDVRWWVVHRDLAIAHDDDKTALEDAITAYTAALYTADPASVREAAHYRTTAMALSDKWVETSRQSGHPLLPEVLADLQKCYRSLSNAVSSKPPIRVD